MIITMHIVGLPTLTFYYSARDNSRRRHGGVEMLDGIAFTARDFVATAPGIQAVGISPISEK